MFKVLEYLWLGIAIFSIISGVYITLTDGLDEAYLFFFITLFAAVFYTIRRRQRIKDGSVGPKA